MEEREFGDALLLVGADALYYDAALTLGALGAAGAVQTFLGALSRAVLATRKTGGCPVGLAAWAVEAGGRGSEVGSSQVPSVVWAE